MAQGVGRAVVTATGMDTEMGSIAEMLEATEEEPSTLQKEIAGVSKLLGITVIAIAVVVMIVTALVNDVSTASDFVTVLLLGVSLAVAAVPEGLPAICPSCWPSGKTGTLTQNQMTIQRIRTASVRSN